MAVWKKVRGPFWSVLGFIMLVEGVLTGNAMHVALAAGLHSVEALRKFRETTP